MTLAVEVGERCILKGCVLRTCVVGEAMKEGLGSALTWKSRLDSKNVACSSMTAAHVSAFPVDLGTGTDFPSQLGLVVLYGLCVPKEDSNGVAR